MTATTTQTIELNQKFHDLLDERQAAAEAIKMLEEDKKKLDDQVKAALAEFGIKEVRTVKWSVKLTESERKTLDENMLLQNGVRAEVIAASKKVTPVVSLSVRPVKEDKS